MIQIEGENRMIDEETRKIISEFMDEMGVPCTEYMQAFECILRDVVKFALKDCRAAFITQYH